MILPVVCDLGALVVLALCLSLIRRARRFREQAVWFCHRAEQDFERAQKADAAAQEKLRDIQAIYQEQLP